MTGSCWCVRGTKTDEDLGPAGMLPGLCTRGINTHFFFSSLSKEIWDSEHWAWSSVSCFFFSALSKRTWDSVCWDFIFFSSHLMIYTFKTLSTLQCPSIWECQIAKPCKAPMKMFQFNISVDPPPLKLFAHYCWINSVTSLFWSDN